MDVEWNIFGNSDETDYEQLKNLNEMNNNSEKNLKNHAHTEFVQC